MKILHFYKTYYPDSYGGVEEVIHNLANAGQSLGIETKILTLTPNQPGHMIEKCNEIIKVKSLWEFASCPFSISAIGIFKQLAKESDIIHYHFPWPMADLTHFLANVKKPTLVTYHSDIVAQKILFKIYKPLMNKFLKSVDKIVATSHNYINSSPILQKFKHKTNYVLLGKDKNSMAVPKQEKINFWKKTLGDKFFLFIGSFRYYKGLEFLLEAAKGLEIPIALIGGGNQENFLKAKAENLGLKNIYFLGPLPEDDKTALLSLCYGVVFPSHKRSEAFGITLLEGLMFGKPLVSCEIGTGTSFINQHLVTGLVIKPADPEALKAALKYLWNNPAEAKAMGQRSLERYLKLFTVEKMMAGYAEIYNEILNKAK